MPHFNNIINYILSKINGIFEKFGDIEYINSINNKKL